MRGFTSFALVLGLALGCNPKDFTTLEETAWVDSQDIDVASSEFKQVLISSSSLPGDSDFSGAQFIIVGERPLTMQKFNYGTGAGSLDKTKLTVEDSLQLAKEGGLVLVTANPSDGMVVGAAEASGRGPDNPTGYHLVGEAVVRGDGEVDRVTMGFRVASELAWTTIAVSAQMMGAVDTEGQLEIFDMSNAGAVAGTCVIGLEGLGTTFAVHGRSPDDPPVDNFLLGTTGGLEAVSQVEGEADCTTTQKTSQTADGAILVGDYIPGGSPADTRPEVFVAGLGEHVLIYQNTTVAEFGAEERIPAPSDASETWGESLAVGDFDDDGQADLAVGDPGSNAVYVYLLKDLDGGGNLAPAKVLTPFNSRDHFGKSVAAVPFDAGEKDVLVVGNDEDVFTYFRIFSEDESNTDNDPRN